MFFLISTSHSHWRLFPPATTVPVSKKSAAYQRLPPCDSRANSDGSVSITGPQVLSHHTQRFERWFGLTIWDSWILFALLLIHSHLSHFTSGSHRRWRTVCCSNNTAQNNTVGSMSTAAVPFVITFGYKDFTQGPNEMQHLHSPNNGCWLDHAKLYQAPETIPG